MLLCDSCAKLRTELAAEWQALNLELDTASEARLRSRAGMEPPATTASYALIVAGPMAGGQVAARALAEGHALRDEGQGFGWGVTPGATLPGIEGPMELRDEKFR